MHKAQHGIEEVPYFFQGHPSNFKVTGDKKSLIVTRIWTGTPVRIHQWIWNDAQSLKLDGWPWKTIGHLFYITSSFGHHFKSISESKLELQSRNAQFGSKSVIFVPFDLEIWWMTLKNNRAPLLYHVKLFRLKNWRFSSTSSRITRPVTASKSLRFALFQVKSMGPPGCHYIYPQGVLNWLPVSPASIATMAQHQPLHWANVGTPALGQHGFVNCANVEPTLAQLCILMLGQCCANDCMPLLCQHWPNGQIHVGPTLVYQCWPNVCVPTLAQRQCANLD